MRVMTSRFHNKKIAEMDVVPVAIALGVPGFPLGFKVRAKSKLIVPDRWMLNKQVTQERYRQAYRAKLDEAGYPAIKAELEAISRANGGRDLVLLCWEDIRKPGEWCHRTMFAEWWAEHSGQGVLELESGQTVGGGGPVESPVPQLVQGSLF